MEYEAFWPKDHQHLLGTVPTPPPFFLVFLSLYLYLLRNILSQLLCVFFLFSIAMHGFPAPSFRVKACSLFCSLIHVVALGLIELWSGPGPI